MIRGTTASFKFKLPYAKDELRWATIKFWQPNNPSTLLPITRTLEHCQTTDNSSELCVSLTAEETSRFIDKYKAKLQLRAQHLNSGTVFGTKPQLFTVYPMSDDILEENPILPDETPEGIVILDGNTIVSDEGGDNV